MTALEVASDFGSYRPPLQVWEGAPCVSRAPSLVLRCTVQLEDRAARDSSLMQDVASCTTAEGKFDPRTAMPLLGGRFRYLECIAEGVSAVVITAEDTYKPSREVVVIKVMHQQYRECALQEARLLRFLNAKDASDISHIVRLRSVFEAQGHVCLVMERLYGSLLDYLELEALRRRPKEDQLSDIRKIGYQLLTSLSFLHVVGLTHADLKLENVLMQRPCNLQTEAREPSSGVWGSVAIKLADFGNAFNSVDRDGEDFNIQTLSYRAPETLLGCSPLTPAIDMWSLGCIFAELALQRLLFAAQTPAQLLQQMAAALGGLPPRTVFASGKLSEQVFREAGLAASDQPEAPTSACHSSGKGLLEEDEDPRGKLRGCFGNQLDGLGRQLEVFGRLSKLRLALSAIDPALADLVGKLLEYDPALRLTPARARAHPFFKPLNPFQAIEEAFPSAERLRKAQERAGASKFQFRGFDQCDRLQTRPLHLSKATQTMDGLDHSGREQKLSEAPVPVVHIGRSTAKVKDDVAADVSGCRIRAEKASAPFPTPTKTFRSVTWPSKSLFTLDDAKEPPAQKDRTMQWMKAQPTAAELKSVPLKKQGVELGLQQRVTPPPLCNTALPLSSQAAAAFGSRRLGLRGMDKAGCARPQARFHNGVHQEQAHLRESETRPGASMKERPVAVQTWERGSTGGGVNAPNGTGSFAARLVAKQGVATAARLTKEADTSRGEVFLEKLAGLAASRRSLKAAGALEQVKCPIYIRTRKAEPQPAHLIKGGPSKVPGNGAGWESAALQGDTEPTGEPGAQPQHSAALKASALKVVARPQRSGQGEVSLVEEGPGAALASKEKAVEGASDSPCSDSCASVVIYSAPSDKKHLERTAEDEAVSSRKRTCDETEVAASEFSLAVGVCMDGMIRKEEMKSERGKKRSRIEKERLEEFLEGAKALGQKGRAQATRGRSVPSKAPPPLQKERVLPRRPARVKSTLLPWWIALPPDECKKGEEA